MSRVVGWRSTCVILVAGLAATGISGCDRSSSDERVQGPGKAQFGIYWPPRDLERAPKASDEPLLRGELSASQNEADGANAFRVQVTLRRPHDDEPDRIRWNEGLAFPEHSWMSKVRVWDKRHQWLWPNLPFLLRAHGEEREERYGGIDPGKGVDNDFAAVLIRSFGAVQNERWETSPAETPLVSAEWYPVGATNTDKQSVVHIARSDEFTLRLSPSDKQAQSGKLGVWLIYADFLDARAPGRWPRKTEYAGGILAYFEVAWQRSRAGEFSFEFEQLVPPTDTGFDWVIWSTGPEALEKTLEMALKPA